MNKGEFSAYYSKLVKSSPCGKPLRGEGFTQILAACKKSTQYQKKANREDVQIIPYMREFGKKRQKFLCLVEGGKEQVISKSKLVEQLYPTKSRSTPEQKHRKEVLVILRNLVESQLLDFRRTTKAKIVSLAEAGDIMAARDLNRCKLTGKSLHSCRTVVDHVVPFAKLVDDWLAKEKIGFNDIFLGGRGQRKYFKRTELMESWQKFHKKKARLQMACSRANSRAGAKGYKTRK